MMKYFCTNNDIIKMVRGDDNVINFYLCTGTFLKPIPYQLKDGEFFYFGVMQSNQRWEDSIIRKRIGYEASKTNGIIPVVLSSTDTENIIPGTYYYMVKIYVKDENSENYLIKTVIDKTKFIIM